MAPRKNEFTKRAEDLLAGRRAAVQQLGDLLDQKSEQEAALAETNNRIQEAVRECLDAGWKPNELAEIGVPKNALPSRRPRSATLEPRTPASQPRGSAAPTEGADPGHDGAPAHTHDQAVPNTVS